MHKLKFLGTAIATLAATAAGVIVANSPVLAQAAYGSYLGAAASFGLTSDNLDQGQQVGAGIAVRYKLLKIPISLRTQALIGDRGTAVVPTISYDIPLSWQTDLYLGVGASFASGTRPSPVGDQTSFALQPGIDIAIPKTSLVIFTNAIIAFDAYRRGGGTAVSLQAGLGLRF